MRVSARRCMPISFVCGALWVSMAGCSGGASFDRAAATQEAIESTSEALHGASNSSAFLEQSTIVPKVAGSSKNIVYKEDFDKGTDKFAQFLRDHVFAEGNLETEDGQSATFLLRPAVMCEVSNDSCTDFFTKNQIRLLVSSPSEGDVQIALLYSEQRFNPLTFHVSRQRVGLSVDLGASADTIRAFNGDAGMVPDHFAGVVLFELVKNAVLDYSLRVSVVQDIAISLTKDSKQYAFGLAATSPTWEARANGNTRTITLTENLGAVSGKVPLSAFVDSVFDLGLDDPAAGNDPIDVLFAGLTGAVNLDGASDHLRFTGVGLGNATSFIKHGQDVLFSADLNAQSGRTMDLDVSLATDDSTMIQFSPMLDMTLHFAFSALANQVRNLPAYTLDDTLRVNLAGDAHPTIKSLRNAAHALQVVTGQLMLTSSAFPDKNITVSAGQCLSTQTPASGDDHPFSQYQVGLCQ